MNNETIIKQCLKEAYAECSVLILPVGWNSFRTEHSTELKSIEAVYMDSCLDFSSNGWNLDFLEYLEACNDTTLRKDSLNDLFGIEPLLLDIFESQHRLLAKYLRCYGHCIQDVGYLEEYHHGTILYFRRDLRIL